MDIKEGRQVILFADKHGKKHYAMTVAEHGRLLADRNRILPAMFPTESYRCDYCDTVFADPMPNCPNCGAPLKRVKIEDAANQIELCQGIPVEAVSDEEYAEMERRKKLYLQDKRDRIMYAYINEPGSLSNVDIPDENDEMLMLMYIGGRAEPDEIIEYFLGNGYYDK